MRILLDTCIFLWFISGDERLSDPIREDICDSKNEVYLSTVSVWESIVKYQLGRLPLPEPPGEYLPIQRKRHRISSLLLDEGSVVHLANLPPIHRDPFDRMLICQAIEHNLTLVTVDNMIRSYPVRTI
ncbi:MAG: PIN domain protein [Candidatus Scalindua rubra]|uniref:PIN domain protein n=1 Tax=Candidatus Scalindua rubra TaxID=1872076 RepID=A0A1E3XAK9_9BACT|nr:MAG: PIN domain protein [Candidatus Scalindua rubra]